MNLSESNFLLNRILNFMYDIVILEYNKYITIHLDNIHHAHHTSNNVF